MIMIWKCLFHATNCNHSSFWQVRHPIIHRSQQGFVRILARLHNFTLTSRLFFRGSNSNWEIFFLSECPSLATLCCQIYTQAICALTASWEAILMFLDELKLLLAILCLHYGPWSVVSLCQLMNFLIYLLMNFIRFIIICWRHRVQTF